MSKREEAAAEKRSPRPVPFSDAERAALYGGSDRFWSMVRKSEPTGCWAWTGAKINGYGAFTICVDGNKRTTRAHRCAWELVRGRLEGDMVLDHLCRNKACVNPNHLEPVTSKENTLRGVSPTAVNAKAKVCSRGHPLIGENVAFRTRPGGGRVCKLCKKLRGQINFQLHQGMKLRDAFKAGAAWQKAEILALLRSEEALERYHQTLPTPHNWAAWLESKLGEGKE